MAVLLDTGVLVGALSPKDPLHRRAAGVLERLGNGQRGALLVTDGVVMEGLSLLRRRVGDRALSQGFADWALGDKPVLKVCWTDESLLREAVALHFRHYDRGLSPIDGGLLAWAKRLDCAVATFDSQFQGLVHVVD